MHRMILVAAAAAALAICGAAQAADVEWNYDLGAQSAPLPVQEVTQLNIGAGHINVAAGINALDIDLIDRDGAPAYTEFIYSAPANVRTGDIFFQNDDLLTFVGAGGHLAGNDLGFTTDRDGADFTEQI